MIDVEFLTELRQWAWGARRDVRDRVNTAPGDAGTALANTLAEQFGALVALTTRTIDSERERLQAAVTEAETRAREASDTFDKWDRAVFRLSGNRLADQDDRAQVVRRMKQAEAEAEAADEALRAARAALVEFDAATKGGER